MVELDKDWIQSKMRDLPLYTILHKFEDQLHIPTKIECQKQVIDTFYREKDNPFLNEIMNKEKTLIETVEELSKGIKKIKILPRRGDKEHNQKVKKLGELIPINELVLTKWNFFSPCNSMINMALESGISFGAFIYLISGSLSIAAPLAIPVALIGAGFYSIFYTHNNFSPRYKSAEYIDNKIKEIYG